MRRRVRPPQTQLARAGERTVIITADRPVPEIRFRASCLEGTPSGRVEVDRADGPETLALSQEVAIDGNGLVAISVVPDADTAISFLPIDRPDNPVLFVAGLAMLAGASLWTLYDFMTR